MPAALMSWRQFDSVETRQLIGVVVNDLRATTGMDRGLLQLGNSKRCQEIAEIVLESSLDDFVVPASIRLFTRALQAERNNAAQAVSVSGIGSGDHATLASG